MKKRMTITVYLMNGAGAHQVGDTVVQAGRVYVVLAVDSAGSWGRLIEDTNQPVVTWTRGAS